MALLVGFDIILTKFKKSIYLWLTNDEKRDIIE